MLYRDPKCVFVTEDPGIADVIVDSLGHEGIQAQVMNRATLGGLVGLTVFSKTGVPAAGIEVWVLDEKQVPRALEVIEEFSNRRSERKSANEALGDIDAKCEECGESSTFPGKLRGTVQDCPRCGAYMDIPGGDEEFDWSAADEPNAEP